jgi:hypothetical protein
VKDLGKLKYFLGIEVARSARGIVLTQRKYVLDLLNETGMIQCRAAATPIDQNCKITVESAELVEKEGRKLSETCREAAIPMSYKA